MGTSITSYAEVRTDDDTWTKAVRLRPDAKYDWQRDEVFVGGNYTLFGFLADVRNYSHSPVITEPRGLPDDASAEVRGDHDNDFDFFSASWLTLAELLAYDYGQVVWDRRITREISPGCWDGAALAEEGEGRHLPLRDLLGESEFFDALELLKTLGEPDDVRIVFWFTS